MNEQKEQKRKKVNVPTGEHETKLSERILQTVFIGIVFIVALVIILGIFSALSNIVQFILVGIAFIISVFLIADAWTNKMTTEYKKVFEDELTDEDKKLIEEHKEIQQRKLSENKKPILKNWKFYFSIIILIVSILLGINADNTDKESVTTNNTTPQISTTSNSTTQTTTANNEQKLKELINKPLSEAIKTSKDLGFSINYKHANTGYDFSKEVSVFDDDELSRWIVTDCSDIDINKKTATFSINTTENVAQNNEAEKLKESLESKLDTTTAWNAVTAYGKTVYPYGFKIDYYSGYTAEPKDENTWFLKATAKVTNEYNAKMDIVFEAYVTGSNDNPEVTEFNIY